MKKWIVIGLIVVIFQNWGTISNLLNPPPDYALAHDGKVILYSTSWCGYCAKARRLLRDNGIAYHEYDIEKSREGYDQYESLGGRGVPLLLINGEVIKGYNPDRIMALAKGI